MLSTWTSCAIAFWQLISQFPSQFVLSGFFTSRTRGYRRSRRQNPDCSYCLLRVPCFQFKKKNGVSVEPQNGNTDWPRRLPTKCVRGQARRPPVDQGQVRSPSHSSCCARVKVDMDLLRRGFVGIRQDGLGHVSGRETGKIGRIVSIILSFLDCGLVEVVYKSLSAQFVTIVNHWFIFSAYQFTLWWNWKLPNCPAFFRYIVEVSNTFVLDYRWTCFINNFTTS
jgi:hypothetical protein